MLEITNEITNIVSFTNLFIAKGSSFTLNKDIWDYAGIVGIAVAPITAIVFSIYNNLQIRKIRSEDLAREEELIEKSELKAHYQSIDKFIDDQLDSLDTMTDRDFMNTIVRIQSLISKCGMITRDKTRDHMIYIISAYAEVACFLLTEINTNPEEEIFKARQIFLSSIKEFDLLLVNRDIKALQQRIETHISELNLICTVPKIS